MLDALLDLVLPRTCAGCGLPGVALCARCGALAPVRLEHGGLPVVAAAPYDGGLRTALIAYKERQRRELARPLGGLLLAAVASFGRPDAELVPVPSRRLGRDHVRRLARTEPALRLCRSVRDSAGLRTDERAANLSGAMRARPGSGRVAIVVDDIVTTGATLIESARALHESGWIVVGAATVAATPRRGTANTSDTHRRSTSTRRHAGLT